LGNDAEAHRQFDSILAEVPHHLGAILHRVWLGEPKVSL
jgi:hypothetical protein